MKFAFIDFPKKYKCRVCVIQPTIDISISSKSVELSWTITGSVSSYVKHGGIVSISQ